VKGSPRNQSTNIEGLYACGECDYQYHGANRLGANSLVSCIFGGFVAGPAAIRWARARAGEASTALLDTEVRRMDDLYFGKPDPDTLLPLTGELLDEVQTRLLRLGYESLDAWAGVENYEERIVKDNIDPVVLEKLREATP